MTEETSDKPALPALTVTFGSTKNKTRVLDKISTVLGKSRMADIKIDAPEVAAVHAIVTRGPSGLAIRDCDSRSGTLVNGQPIKECVLKAADTIQIGPFSFQVLLPDGFDAATWGSAALASQEIGGAQHLTSDADSLQRQNVELMEKVEKLGQENERLKASGGANMAKGSATTDSIAALQAEIDVLKTTLQEVDEQRARLLEELRVFKQDSEHNLANLREELDKERNRLKDVMKQAASQFTAARQESVHLRQQNELYQAELAAKQAELDAALAAASGVPALPADVVEYQNQLNSFRDELEQAQMRLQEQEAALNESIRQNELQLSRERAETAREKAIIERTRNELRTELEVAEREAKNFEKMSSIHKLTREIRSAAGPEQDNDPASNTLSNRIKGFLRRLGDS